MQFEILGPLKIHSDSGDYLHVTQPRYRNVLCLLLLGADTLVPRRELAKAIWAYDMPDDPAGSLRTCMYSLRKSLGYPNRLHTSRAGFSISLLDGDILDLKSFRELIADGTLAAEHGNYIAATRTLQDALFLWRSPPLVDFPENAATNGSINALVEQHAHVRESLVYFRLELGQHRELIVPLREAVASDPLRERCWEQLMIALYRSGSRAAALEAYTTARAILAEECGIEPGTGLRELQHRMLTADPKLDYKSHQPTQYNGLSNVNATVAQSDFFQPSPDRTATVFIPAMPRELPCSVQHFTGRHDELTSLTTLLERTNAEGQEPAPISVIGGAPGVGKTALALHWAHQVVEHFPDGQLYVNLYGYDTRIPMLAEDALAVFLRSLGMQDQDIPDSLDERAARYRTLTANRRILVILDNASSVQQVRALLPGSSSCATIVTSRTALAGLIARNGALRLDLDMLSLADSTKLLHDLIGERVTADPAGAEAIAKRCCRLPLALRVAAELVGTRPSEPLSDILAGLSDQRRRLDLLDAGGDSDTGLRTVFSWSFRNLSAEAVRAFCRVSAYTGHDFDCYAAAALIGTTLKGANGILLDLIRECLIQPVEQGRYAMHDLLRDYAKELTASNQSEATEHDTLARLSDYYLSAAAAAVEVLYPTEASSLPRIPAPASPVPAIASEEEAQVWLDAELPNLVAAAEYAANNSWTERARQLSLVLCRYRSARGRFPRPFHSCRFAC